MTRTALCLLLLPFCTLADDAELWLVELEHNDGVRLQFQGPSWSSAVPSCTV